MIENNIEKFKRRTTDISNILFASHIRFLYVVKYSSTIDKEISAIKKKSRFLKPNYACFHFCENAFFVHET